MLSGIGPGDELATHDIPLRVDLPGVGRNLQDRYEIPVVNRMNFPQWRVFRGARFAQDDPLFKQWQRLRQGPYITNGGVLAAFRRSFADRETPDIFCLALLGLFRGYFPNYSALFAENLNYLTWVVLKAHTNNCAGRVKLRYLILGIHQSSTSTISMKVTMIVARTSQRSLRESALFVRSRSTSRTRN